MFLVMLASILIAGLWSYIPIIKKITHTILDPSVGFLLNWNIYFGMFFVVFVISLGMTLAQKYLTDQETLRKMKEEQKLAKEEMKKYKNEPEKLLPTQKKVLILNSGGMKCKEIAEILDIPVDTVKTRILRGRRKLKQVLSTYQQV